MNIKVRRHKPFYKSFFKLRENVTNNLKLRSFKKKKWTYLVKRLTIFNRKRIKLLNHNVFNICSNKPIKITKIINFFNKKYGNVKIKKILRNKLDVKNTHGSNKTIKKLK